MSDELTVLELLAREASTEQFETVVTTARQSGVTGTRLETLERAKQLGLSVRSQLERRQQREAALTALVDTARELAAADDLDTMLNLATRRTRLLLSIDMAYISLPDEERDEMCIRAAAGLMSAATTRSHPASAADTAMMPVPQPISRKDPVRGTSIDPPRPRRSIATPVEGEYIGAKTSGSRSHVRPYIVNTAGRSARVRARRLRSNENR